MAFAPASCLAGRGRRNRGVIGIDTARPANWARPAAPHLIGRFLAAIAVRQGRTYRLAATRANGQLAFGAYLRDPGGRGTQANDPLVLTLAGSRISAMTRFHPGLLPRFGLPLSQPCS